MATREIWQEIKINASPNQVYQALTDVKKLSHWWTTDTRGESVIGRNLEFWFGGRSPSATMEVTALKEGELVRWKATERTTPDWLGTELEFKIFGEDGRSVVHLRHSKWARMRKCSPNALWYGRFIC